MLRKPHEIFPKLTAIDLEPSHIFMQSPNKFLD